MEHRPAADGKYYTREQFQHYYGPNQWERLWRYAAKRAERQQRMQQQQVQVRQQRALRRANGGGVFNSPYGMCSLCGYWFALGTDRDAVCCADCRAASHDAARIDAEEVELPMAGEPGASASYQMRRDAARIDAEEAEVERWYENRAEFLELLAKADEVAEGVDNPQAPAPSPPTYGSGRRG